MSNFIDIKGKIFYRWTVIQHTIGEYWLCQCDCGVEKEVCSYNLRHRISKSCGCWRDEKAVIDNLKHGYSDTLTYKRWLDMHQRCENPNNRRYKDWGGRGIKVCDRWHKDNPDGFMNYIKDIELLGDRLDNTYTLDRIDNDKDYSPDNIRWANKRKQRINQRSSRIRYLEYAGVKKTLKEWSIELQAYSSNILYFIKRGKSFEWIYEYYKNKKGKGYYGSPTI